ncbi:MAG: hypothetical protein J5966_10410 [Lachnospiraceae bacterium]|nr:hypothetical protein [Lachnospiraceae bacterium]
MKQLSLRLSLWSTASGQRREGRQLRLKLKELKDLHIKEGCPAAFIHDLNEINPGFLRRGILRCMHRESRVITGDLDLLAPEWFEQDISCYAEKDGELAGLLLVHRINETSLRVEVLSGISKTPPAETYTLIKQAIGAAKKNTLRKRRS